MIFSYNWLQSFFNKKLPSVNQLAGLLSSHFAVVDEIKKQGNDFLLDIDIRPNRATDCFSHLGLAREIAAILNYRLKKMAVISKKNKQLKAGNYFSLQIKDKSICRRYTARAIEGVKVKPSPAWLKQRLVACGLHPINNIVDIANYLILETGQPFHVFDADKIAGRQLIVRFARQSETIVSLNNEKYRLAGDTAVIADKEKPLAIAGIKGGRLAEIDRQTKTIILEAANFDPQIIRRTAKKLKLKTDASLRFEHGLSPELTELAINRASYLIKQLAGSRQMSALVDFYPYPPGAKRIKLSVDYLQRLLGVEITVKETIKILQSLNFKIIRQSKSAKPYLIVEVPGYRLDVSLPEDLIEEIGRLYGYRKIPAVLPLAALVPPQNNDHIFWQDTVKNILKQAGFYEVYNYSFLSDDEAEIFGLAGLIELENPLSCEQKYLRSSLIPGLLKNIKKNKNYFDRINIFEMGKVFQKPKIEKTFLSGLIYNGAFEEVKGVIDLLFSKMGINSFWCSEPEKKICRVPIKQRQDFAWHPRKCGRIKIKGKPVGFLGEMSPQILGQMDIKKNTVLFDIDFDILCRLATSDHQYRPISKFPAVLRDIAVLLPEQIKVAEALEKIYQAGGQLLRRVELFDIYQGRELPAGKKNLAFRLIFQSETSSLTNQQIDILQNKIIKSLEENPEWQVRK